jgi:putative ABC transport system substrate-binding protein
MRRREFIALLAGATASWPLAARTQAPKKLVIGFLNTGSAQRAKGALVIFHEALRETGFIENSNVTIEYRWAENNYDRLPTLAADLVHHQATVIVTSNSMAALAAKAATSKTPIVFLIGIDPIEVGLVTNLQRPDGNITGVTVLSRELSTKRLELMHEVAPSNSSIALIVNPNNANVKLEIGEVEKAARVLSVPLQVMEATDRTQIERIFEKLAGFRLGGVVLGADALFYNEQQIIAELSLRYAVPVIHDGAFAKAGGLMSYGTNFNDAWGQVGRYVGRILNGDKLADLPVQQATKVELSINLKTAKTLGLTVPASLLARADDVIE